jgi:hypothetical protein
MGAELVGAHQELAWLDAEQRLHAHFGDDVLAEAHSALQALVAQPPPSHPVMVPRGENAQDRAFREQLSDQLTELQAQRDALARAVLRPHCPLGCVEHREHYFVIEVEIGPLPEPVRSMVDTDLAKLFEAIADMAMSKRDDVNMSAAVLSDVAIGLTDSSLYDCP